MWRFVAPARGCSKRLLPTGQVGHTAITDVCEVFAGFETGCSGGLGAPLQVRWARKKKRKKREKMSEWRERVGNLGGDTAVRLEDRYMEPTPNFKMYLTIKKHMDRLTSDGRHNNRRAKDLLNYTNYRVLRLARLTHDNPREDVERKGFVTPLTELQDRAHLPRSANDRRFTFPHTLSYKCYWGPPTVYDEPNKYEGSMVGCKLAMRLDDLPLTAQQRSLLTDIVGPKRHDERTGVVAIEADQFPERNQNAALLGDMVEELMREVTDGTPSLPESQGPVPRIGRRSSTRSTSSGSREQSPG
mmetsp:Transcript_25712/g.59979  ORF Transcript_25712/g.59979 Transcript_25712/m.59979 type:complete len:301 (-) Transcript_25712:12-914(-)